MKTFIKKVILGSSIALIALGSMAGASFAASGNFANNQESAGLNIGGQDNLGIDPNSTAENSLLTTFRSAVNWVLGLLGFIALCLLIWGGFKMLTAAGDEGKYKDGFKVIRQALIGLVMIGLSALFVNAVMWIIARFAHA